MSDVYTDDEIDDEVDEPTEEAPSALRRQLDKANRKAKEQAAELATLKRESAFRAAGIDPNDPKARYFVKGYEGELDAEAIKAEAAEAGIISPEAPTTPEAEMKAHEQAAQITAGADAPASLDQNQQYLADLDAAGLDKEKVLEVMRKHGSPIVENLD